MKDRKACRRFSKAICTQDYQSTKEPNATVFPCAILVILTTWQLISVMSKTFKYWRSQSKTRTELLAVDVGAAPGGWTGYLATLTKSRTRYFHQKKSNFSFSKKLVKIILNFCSIVAIDPAELEEGVADRPNVVHLKHKVNLYRRSGRQDAVLKGKIMCWLQWLMLSSSSDCNF